MMKFDAACREFGFESIRINKVEGVLKLGSLTVTPEILHNLCKEYAVIGQVNNRHFVNVVDIDSTPNQLRLTIKDPGSSQNVVYKFKDITQLKFVGAGKQANSVNRSQDDVKGNQGGVSEEVIGRTVTSGYDNPSQLKALLGSGVSSVSIVEHSNSGRRGYEIELKTGEKVLCYDGFPDSSRKDLMLVRKVDQNGGVGYTDRWQKTGEAIKTNSLKTSDVQLSGRSKIDLGGLTRASLRSDVGFSGGNFVGGIIGSTLAKMDQYKDNTELALDLGKNGAISGGMAIVGMVSSKVPGVNKVVPIAMSAVNIVKIGINERLSGGEKVIHTVNTLASTVVSVGASSAGFMAGVEMGVLAGIATGPGAIITGLVGGIIGGFVGTKAAKLVSDVMISKMTIHFDLEGHNKQPGNPPSISIRDNPDKAVDFVTYMEIDGSIYWAEARTGKYG